MIKTFVCKNEFSPIARDADSDTAKDQPEFEIDARLVERVLEGDQAAFEHIFDRHKRFVAAIARRYFRQPDQIEEVIQICFTKAYFELKTFRGRYELSLKSWLGKITRNVCLDIIKKRKRKPTLLECEISSDDRETLLGDNQNIENNSEKNLVERDLAESLLTELTPSDREILQMLHAEEMSVSEISEITGWSKSKIKVRAYRARISLRKVLRKFL